MADPRELARSLRAIAQRPTGAVGMPGALTPAEAAGGMMESAERPDVARLVQGLRAVSQSMGGSAAERLADLQSVRIVDGHRSPREITPEVMDVALGFAGGGMAGTIKSIAAPAWNKAAKSLEVAINPTRRELAELFSVKRQNAFEGRQ